MNVLQNKSYRCANF